MCLCLLVFKKRKEKCRAQECKFCKTLFWFPCRGFLIVSPATAHYVTFLAPHHVTSTAKELVLSCVARSHPSRFPCSPMLLQSTSQCVSHRWLSFGFVTCSYHTAFSSSPLPWSASYLSLWHWGSFRLPLLLPVLVPSVLVLFAILPTSSHLRGK